MRSLATALPEREVSLAEEAEELGIAAGQLGRLKATIGLDRRRVVPEGMTALDLAEAAGKRVLERSGLGKDDVDAILMVTQTPDYQQPGNAVLLQDRFGLGTGTAALDVNLGCSGFVYGLWTAASQLKAGGLRRVLLLVGDTVSQLVGRRDRALRPLFGDAASACLLEADAEAEEWVFELRSDGSGYQSLWQPGGGAREPYSAETATLRTVGEGVERSRCHLHMDGAEIFNFSLKVELPAIREVLAARGWAAEDVDGYVFHQANRYILGNIRRRLQLPVEKVPDGTVEKYGNQSGASIPATLTDHYGQALCERRHRMVLSGFGVGLSWASCALELGPLEANELVELG